jgi:SAM-dependent methyltransferase
MAGQPENAQCVAGRPPRRPWLARLPWAAQKTKRSHVTTDPYSPLTRFSPVAGFYDDVRPATPAVLVDILKQYADVPKPKLVVDVGSGTGLSSRAWSEHAQQVIGIEPNPQMREQATSRTRAANVSYWEGTSSDTRVDAGAADIATCSQSFHWMDPEETLAEMYRILRPGGVFAIYYCTFPPVMNWEMEQRFQTFMSWIDRIDEEHRRKLGIRHGTKTNPLPSVQQSGLFRLARDFYLHNPERGNARRLASMVRSFSGVATLLKSGCSEEEIGLTALDAAAHELLGDELRQWYFSYEVVIAVK